MTEKGKRVCSTCNWRGKDPDLLVATSPFAREIITGCPACKSVNSTHTICDEPGCWEPDTCGCPSPEGYRRVCGEHYGKSLLDKKEKP